MAHPAVLADLLAQYETLRARTEPAPGSSARRELDDVIYTLCVSTGTRSIEQAVSAAERHISASRPLGRGEGHRRSPTAV